MTLLGARKLTVSLSSVDGSYRTQAINCMKLQSCLEQVVHVRVPRNKASRELQVSAVSGPAVHRRESDGDTAPRVAATPG